MPAAGSLSPGPAACIAGADLQHWLDALAGGSCQQDDFFDEILRREPADPAIIVDVFAQLDQYYRRKLVDRETYVRLKSRFQHHSLGTGMDGTAPRPPPRERDPRSRAASAVPWVDATDEDEPAPEAEAEAD